MLTADQAATLFNQALTTLQAQVLQQQYPQLQMSVYLLHSMPVKPAVSVLQASQNLC